MSREFGSAPGLQAVPDGQSRGHTDKKKNNTTNNNSNTNTNTYNDIIDSSKTPGLQPIPHGEPRVRLEGVPGAWDAEGMRSLS